MSAAFSSGSLRAVLPDLLVHSGAVNAGVLLSGNAALVINPGNPGLAAALAQAGVANVEKVLFTHHRRELADGLAGVLERFAPALGGPRAEERLFTDPAAYWAQPSSRWYLLCGHVPYHVTHVRPVPLSETYADGDAFHWHEWKITVLATPGYTDGSVSYLAENGECRALFSGDLMYAPGQVRDLFSLQHANTINGHGVGDYHGFLGSAETLIASLARVRALGAGCLIPAHGVVMDRPAAAIDLLTDRLREAYASYVQVSALRWYFPGYFEPFPIPPERRIDAETAPFPPAVRRIHGTTWMLVAESGRALLIDPYCDEAVAKAAALVESGEVAGFDGIWITHFHYDHTEGAELARERFGCPVITDKHMADVLRYPLRYFLTCLSPTAICVERPTEHGETWKWENYTLTAYHLPGQTYYHSGLLAVADSGERLFFSGDSFTPTGIDDYCSWNRNFLGGGAGYACCVRLLRECDPHWIFNQHVEVGFRFTDADYARILANLEERQVLFTALMPWEHPDCGTDEYWVHTYPYEQVVRPGQWARVQVHLWNHAHSARGVSASLDLPAGWAAFPEDLSAPAPAGCETRLTFDIQVPGGAEPGRYVLPARVCYGGTDLGSFREAIVVVDRGAQ